MELQHCNRRINPTNFKIVPKLQTFKAKIPMSMELQSKPNDKEVVDMKGMQVPILINNATTGHKLQGSGVDNLFIHSWSYVPNWVYVMLSRVTTIQGLYLRERLSTDLKHYSMPSKLKMMIDYFEQKHFPTIWSDNDYTQMFGI